MKQALIIGASGGIGAALSQHLVGQGWQVTGLSRSTGFDLTDAAGVDAQLCALPEPFDMILIASGALEIDGHGPEKSLSALSAQAMADQFAVNTIGPALVLRHAARLLPKDRRAVVAALSARVGSIGDNRLGGWTSYRASKAALNQVIRCAAIELARSHKQALCVALHPGTVQTDLTRRYLGRHPAVTPPEAAQNLMAVLAGLNPENSGQFYDWAGKAIPW
jgi:NAD(P)-dependent dehydrogenase (short-subunit alcohol dehydrogenase family)